jgi:UDP-N-acetylmuramate--alanine ligase
MPQAILDNARTCDVVICMGAGSIGAVPAKVVEIGGAAAARKSERLTREGRAL